MMLEGSKTHWALEGIFPQPLMGIARGDDSGENRGKIALVTAIRLAMAAGIFYAVKKSGADRKRVSGLVGTVLSAPAAGMYWGGKFLCDGVRKIKDGVTSRSMSKVGWGTAHWLGGALVLHISQIISSEPINSKGWRWGLVEILNHKISEGIKYRDWKGY